MEELDKLEFYSISIDSYDPITWNIPTTSYGMIRWTNPEVNKTPVGMDHDDFGNFSTKPLKYLMKNTKNAPVTISVSH